VAGVKEAITTTGAMVLFLPPYSPDLNPIAKFFSNHQARLRHAAKRDVDVLWKEIAELLNTVSASECTNYFASCGYVNTEIAITLELAANVWRRFNANSGRTRWGVIS